MTLAKRLTTQPEWLLLAGLMALRLLATARTGLVPDESYYWLWAQHPALGYFDHPPMVAWWISIGTLFGNAALFVRLPFLVSFLALCIVSYDAARCWFGRQVAWRTVLWLNASLLLSVGSVMATPDPPSVLMWAAGLWTLARLQTSGNGIWWLAFGLFEGLGCLSKYTNLFMGLGVLLWFVIDVPARRWLTTIWPWLGAGLALAVLSPNLAWNAAHGWSTLAKQFGRIGASHLTISYLAEFLISQPFLLNPILCVFVGLGYKAWLKNRQSGPHALLIALPSPLIIYLLIHVFHDRVQGNWTAPIFPGLIILAAATSLTGSPKWKVLSQGALPLGAGLTAVILIWLSLGQGLAGAAGLSQGWEQLSQALESKATQTGADWIATTDYDTQGELSYHLPQSTIFAVVEKSRYGWHVKDTRFLADKALIVVARHHKPDLSRCFRNLTPLGDIARLPGNPLKPDFTLYSGWLISPTCELAVHSETP